MEPEPQQIESSETTWSDLLPPVAELEELLQDEQLSLLLIVLETNLLGTGDDFNITVSGVTLDIKAEEDIQSMRRKVESFIEGLQQIPEDESEQEIRKIRKEARELHEQFRDRNDPTRVKTTRTKRPKPTETNNETLKKTKAEFDRIFWHHCRETDTPAIDYTGDVDNLEDIDGTIHTIINKRISKPGDRQHFSTRIHLDLFDDTEDSAFQIDYLQERTDLLLEVHMFNLQDTYYEYCEHFPADESLSQTVNESHEIPPRVLYIAQEVLESFSQEVESHHIQKHLETKILAVNQEKFLENRISKLIEIILWAINLAGRLSQTPPTQQPPPQLPLPPQPQQQQKASWEQINQSPEFQEFISLYRELCSEADISPLQIDGFSSEESIAIKLNEEVIKIARKLVSDDTTEQMRVFTTIISDLRFLSICGHALRAYREYCQDLTNILHRIQAARN